MAISWNSTMATGLNNIDSQHRELFRQVDLLIAAMSQGKGRQEVGRILDFLGQYVHDHFADEEQEMDRYQCPAAAANRAAHAQFITTFQAMRRLATEGSNPAMVIQIQNTLTKWLTDHIRRIDTQLLQCVNNGEPAAAAYEFLLRKVVET